MGVKFIEVVCAGNYTNTPRRKMLTGGVILPTLGSISRITRIMLINVFNEINDLA